MYSIDNIFPTPIVRTTLGRDISQDELKIISDNKQLTSSNFGNVTSKNTYILDSLPNIKTKLEDSVDFYVNNIIKPQHNIEFYITQSWLNYTEPGKFHHKHTHSNSIISGSLYFNAQEGKDKIFFFNDSYTQIWCTPREWNQYNSVSWNFPVKTGDIILFPSNLPHSVEPTVSDDTRISLAFNVFVRGDLGDTSELTKLFI
jgi:uncharacterized protein (TIGR02466 family)